MSQERRSPLPAGRYWLDVVGLGNIIDFSLWLDDNIGAVVVETVELDGKSFPSIGDIVNGLGGVIPSPIPSPSPTPIDPDAIPTGAMGGNPPIMFAIFRVTGTPTKLDTKFGFPEIAPASVKTESDTVQVPEPENPVGDAVKTAIAVLEGIAFVIGVKSILDIIKTMRSK